MARRPRTSSATGFFHVVNRAARREKIFLRPQDYRGFIDVLAVRFNPLYPVCERRPAYAD